MKKDLSVTVDLPSRLDKFLHERSGESRTFVQEQIRQGSVHVNGQVALKPSHKLHPNDQITATFEERFTLSLEPIAHPLDILYEDEDLLCLNKPQDMVIHPATGFKGPTLVHYLLHYFNNLPEFKELKEGRPGIVHRLDRGTSGVILVAKSRKTQDLLSQLFKKRTIKKEYEAIIWGKAPKSLHIESTIGRDRKDRKKMSTNCQVGRLAITDLNLVLSTKTFSHVALLPKTGRTHQLRVHLSENRFPVVGDALYGPKNPKHRAAKLNAELQAALEDLSFTLLHAKRLTFLHPISGTELCLEAKRPEVFEHFLSLMKAEDI